MRIFIAGIDGYLGWSLAKYLTERGHEVGGADIFFRRRWVEEMKSCSATPVAKIEDRLKANGVPDDLKYVCIAESSLQQNALSGVGAASFWQIQPGHWRVRRSGSRTLRGPAQSQRHRQRACAG